MPIFSEFLRKNAYKWRTKSSVTEAISIENLTSQKAAFVWLFSVLKLFHSPTVNFPRAKTEEDTTHLWFFF